MSKIPCTVAVLTFNSGDSLRRCLESVKDFAEIIICDGGSTDDTLAIAAEYGCKVIEQDKRYKYANNKIADFSGVRNQTIKAASYRWYLYVDSDEYLTPELVAEVRSIVSAAINPTRVVFRMPRQYSLEGAVIDCASTYPNYHLRFFHLDYVEGFRKAVHERVVVKESVPIEKLKNPSIVPISVDYKAIIKKQDYYLSIEKERRAHCTRKELFFSLRGPLRSIAARWLKWCRNRLFCRGTHLPFKSDIVASRYQMRLLLITLRLLIKKNNLPNSSS